MVVRVIANRVTSLHDLLDNIGIFFGILAHDEKRPEYSILVKQFQCLWGVNWMRTIVKRQCGKFLIRSYPYGGSQSDNREPPR